MGDWTDETIIAKLKSGEERDVNEAMRWLFNEYYGLIRHFILKNSGTIADAEDVFQDSLVVLYQQLVGGQLILKCSIKTYLYSVCRYQWSNHLRKKKEVQLQEEEQAFVVVPESQLKALIDSEEGHLIADLFEQLGAECKQILIYFYYEQLKMKKIAERMKLSSDQVAKNKKSKCLKGLRQLVLNSSFYQRNLRS